MIMGKKAHPAFMPVLSGESVSRERVKRALSR
jgi:hypothetical protein